MICITSVILAVFLVSSFVLSDYVNLIASLFGLGLTLGTTAVVVLLFVPKVLLKLASTCGNSTTSFWKPVAPPPSSITAGPVNEVSTKV